jgi:hypothetical protein
MHTSRIRYSTVLGNCELDTLKGRRWGESVQGEGYQLLWGVGLAVRFMWLRGSLVRVRATKQKSLECRME